MVNVENDVIKVGYSLIVLEIFKILEFDVDYSELSFRQ